MARSWERLSVPHSDLAKYMRSRCKSEERSQAQQEPFKPFLHIGVTGETRLFASDAPTAAASDDSRLPLTWGQVR
jgi:hypothetical protein